MRALVKGELVDKDRNAWEMNGRSGVTYAVFVRAEGSRASDSAERIRVTEFQYGGFETGQVVELPVNIFANVNERTQQGKLSVTLDPEYVTPADSGKRHAAVA